MSCYIVNNETRELNYVPSEITSKDVRRALSAKLDVIELPPAWVGKDGQIIAEDLLAKKDKYGFFNYQNDRLIKVDDPYFRVPDGCSAYQVGRLSEDLYLLANNFLIRIYNAKNFYPEKTGFKRRKLLLKARAAEEEKRKRLEKEELLKKQNEELKQRKLDRLLASIKD